MLPISLIFEIFKIILSLILALRIKFKYTLDKYNTMQLMIAINLILQIVLRYAQWKKNIWYLSNIYFSYIFADNHNKYSYLAIYL